MSTKNSTTVYSAVCTGSEADSRHRLESERNMKLIETMLSARVRNARLGCFFISKLYLCMHTYSSRHTSVGMRPSSTTPNSVSVPLAYTKSRSVTHLPRALTVSLPLATAAHVYHAPRTAYGETSTAEE